MTVDDDDVITQMILNRMSQKNFEEECVYTHIQGKRKLANHTPPPGIIALLLLAP